jgi:putative membrane protein
MMKKWINKYLSENEIKQISAQVTEAEKLTEGEIVPVIVSRSSAVGHVKWVITAILTLVFVIGESIFIQSHWDSVNSMAPPLAFLVFYFMGVYLGKISWFQRVFTPNEDEIAQVHRRAELEFYQTQIKKTNKQTGILIFVSMMERRVVILADEGIAAHYPAETWDEVVMLMVDEFKKGSVFEGFSRAIKKCGEILQNKLPASSNNINQLPNNLIIKD